MSKDNFQIQDKESFYLHEKFTTLSPLFISPLKGGEPTKHEAPCHAFSTWSSDLSMHKRTTRRVRTGPIGLVWGEPAVKLATRFSALLTYEASSGHPP